MHGKEQTQEYFYALKNLVLIFKCTNVLQYRNKLNYVKNIFQALLIMV